MNLEAASGAKAPLASCTFLTTNKRETETRRARNNIKAFRQSRRLGRAVQRLIIAAFIKADEKSFIVPYIVILVSLVALLSVHN